MTKFAGMKEHMAITKERRSCLDYILEFLENVLKLFNFACLHSGKKVRDQRERLVR